MGANELRLRRRRGVVGVIDDSLRIVKYGQTSNFVARLQIRQKELVLAKSPVFLIAVSLTQSATWTTTPIRTFGIYRFLECQSTKRRYVEKFNSTSVTHSDLIRH